MTPPPATPDNSVTSGTKSSAKLALPVVDKTATSKVLQASANEPSPASTYGASAAGDSVPVTPQEINDPAIVAHSIRTSSGIVTRLSGVQLSNEPGASPAEISPIKRAVAGKYTATRSTSNGSTNSSPTANRTKEIRGAATWRVENGGFVKGETDKADVFFNSNESSNEKGPLGSFRTTTVIKGVEITNDNAQALLPPMACVFVANLSSTRSDEQLEYSVTRIFEQFGRVYVKIRRDIKGMPYAFCQYENVGESENAIEHGRGISIDGRQCRTERAKAHRSLYMSRITGGPITEEEAHEELKEFGPFEKIWTCSPTDKEMYRLSEGVWIQWAYFQGARDAQNAFKDHPKFRLEEPSLPAEIKNRADRIINQSPFAKMTPSQAYDSPQLRMWRAPDRNSVYIGGLPTTVTQAQLVGQFQAYGRIRGVEIISKPINSAMGISVFAFIEFSSEEEARCAVVQEHVFEGLRLRVEIKHSPVHVPHRSSYMVSAGSPRRRAGTSSPDSMGGMVNSNVAMGRALASGVHPAVVSFIFSNTTSAQNFSAPTTMATQTNMAPQPIVAPVYAQVPYEAAYYPTQYGTYSSPAAQSEVEMPSGQYQYPPLTYHPYQVLPPYIYPQPSSDVSCVGQTAGQEDTQ